MKIIIAAAIGLFLSVSVSADTIFGVYAGVRMWQQDFGGDFHLPNMDIRPIDVEDDVELDKSANPTIFVAVEHFIPFLPNIKIQRTEIKSKEDSMVDLHYTYIGRDFAVGIDVETDMDLSYDAIVFYYELLDNWVTLDIGLAVADFDSEFSIRQKQPNGFEGITPIEETIPLLYGKVELELPFTGLSTGAEAEMIHYDGHEVSNINAYLSYKLGLGFSANLGYEHAKINLDGLSARVNGTNTPIDADVEAKGPYLGITYHF